MNKILILSIVTSFLLANENNESIDNSQILTPLKNEIYNLQIQSAKEKGIVNKYDWLGEINLNASTTKNQDQDKTNDYSMSITQEIFKFGGILAQYNYGEYQKQLELLEVSMDKKDDLLKLFENLINLKLNQIELEQNALNIKNSQIEVIMKKSSYSQGDIDISDLNDAIMSKNSYEDTKMELEVQKQELINEIQKLTQIDLLKLNIPKVTLMSKENYLEYSSQINYANLEAKVSNEEYKITRSDYLPTLSLNGTYGYSETNNIDGDNYYNYGAKVTMPINFTSLNAIEYGKLQAILKTKQSSQTKIELEKDYDTSVKTIKQYDRRIELANNDIKLYDELLQLNKDQYDAGFKAKEDVETIENSKEIRQLDIKKYKLNQQLELLNLYYELI